MKNLPEKYKSLPGIYYVRHVPTNRYYVGLSVELGDRTAQHNRRLEDGRNNAFNHVIQTLYSIDKDDDWRLGVFKSYNVTEKQKNTKAFREFLKYQEAYYLSKIPFEKRLNISTLILEDGTKVTTPNKRLKTRVKKVAVKNNNYKGRGTYNNPLHSRELRNSYVRG